MAAWLDDAVFYEIFPSSFKDSDGDGIGDFRGIVEKLGYIRNLGFNAIRLAPCFESPFFNGGCDVKDFFDVSGRFGTSGDFDELLLAAKTLGMRVAVDLLPICTSSENAMFRRSGENRPNAFSDRFIWTDSVEKDYPDYRVVYGGYERNGAYMCYKFACQPRLNFGFAEITESSWQRHYKDAECVKTRDWLIDVLKYWIERGVDGFFMLSAGEIVVGDDNGQASAEVWKYVLSGVRKAFPEAVFVSEWGNAEKAVNGAGFDADVYSVDRGNGLFRKFSGGINHSFLGSEGRGDVTAFLRDYLRQIIPTRKKGRIALVSGSPLDFRLARFYDAEQIKLIMGVLLTLPSIPVVYYGDELGMKHLDVAPKEGGYHYSGARTPMQWTDGKNKGFSPEDVPQNKLYLPVDQSANAPSAGSAFGFGGIADCVKALCRLRTSEKDLSTGGFDVEYAERNKFPFVYRRGRFVICVNPYVMDEDAPSEFEGKPIFAIGGEGSLSGGKCRAPARSFNIYEIAGN